MPASSPLYLSALPQPGQPTTSAIFIPANSHTLPGVTSLLQLPHSTSIASQQSSDSSSTVIVTQQQHFLPGMSHHTPPLSFTSASYQAAAVNDFSRAVDGDHPPAVGMGGSTVAAEQIVPTVGPSRAAEKGAMAQPGMGASKKTKAAAAKKTSAAETGDAPKGACAHLGCTTQNACLLAMQA